MMVGDLQRIFLSKTTCNKQYIANKEPLMKYENTFKAIDQILWKEQGCGSELDYLEQKSWMLFLKYLDDLETAIEFREDFSGVRRLETSNITTSI